MNAAGLQQGPRRRDGYAKVCKRPDKAAFVARGVGRVVHAELATSSRTHTLFVCPVSSDHHNWGNLMRHAPTNHARCHTLTV